MRLTLLPSLLLQILVLRSADFCRANPAHEPAQQPLQVIHNAPVAANNSISASLFAELEELARLVDIAYCVGATGLGIQKPFQCLSRCATFENFELIQTWNTGPLLSDSCGYVALSHPPNPRRVIVAFRGTYSIANTVADLTTIPQEYEPYPGADDGSGDEAKSTDADMPSSKPPRCDNCTVHAGFYRSWQNTREVIVPAIEEALFTHPNYSLVLVGHSLGGAVAAFAGLELLARGHKPTITTFGEPRIGNDHLADYVDARFNLTAHSKKPAYRRVTHREDPVPLLPLQEWGYMPHAGEVFISKRDLPPSVADIQYCDGDADPECIEGAVLQDKKSGFWTVPARFKLWQLLFGHRDYFYRLGLCVPGGDPLSKWGSGEIVYN